MDLHEYQQQMLEEPEFILALELNLKKKLLGLNDKSKAALRNTLSEVKFFVTDEICMVSSELRILIQG